jgi:hypothetical protein
MKFSRVVLVCSFFAILACSCLADDYSWDDSSGGVFNNPNKWYPVGVPTGSDTAYFTLPDTYTVTFPSELYNDAVIVDGSELTLDLGGYAYLLGRLPENGRAVIIGQYAENSLLLINHGTVFSREVSIGQFGVATGNLTLSGSDAAWTTSYDGNWHGVWIGEDGDAYLSILDNAHFNHGHGFSAVGADSDAIVDVNGIDSEWYVDGYFGMSVNGKTTVNLANGGLWHVGRLEMATERGSSAQINLTGESQQTELALESESEDSLTLGLRGEGIIHIEDSKLFNAGRMVIAAQPGSKGLLEVHEGSWVDTTESIAIGGTFDSSGGVGHLNIIDEDRSNRQGIDFTPTSAAGQYMLVWPQGTITMDGGAIEMEYDTKLANPIILQGGTLEGNGMIWAHVENHGGTVAPNDDLDQKVLDIGYNYTQDATGTLKIAIGGQEPISQYSHLRVTDPNYGQVSLDGMLEVSLTNGFVPSYDDQFIIVAAKNISGTFSNAVWQYVFKDGSFDVIYDTTSGYNSVILTHYSAEPACPRYPLADINKDCVVDLKDFAIFASEWLECNLVPDYYCSGGPTIM